MIVHAARRGLPGSAFRAMGRPAAGLRRFRGAGRRGAGAAVAGLLFLCSNTLLAFDRFHTPLPAAGLLTLGTFWAAQWLIASALPARN